MIGAWCCIFSGFTPLSGTFLKNSIPFSGIIGWPLGAFFFFCAMYFFGKQIS